MPGWPLPVVRGIVHPQCANSERLIFGAAIEVPRRIEINFWQPEKPNSTGALCRGIRGGGATLSEV
jgi:hypothetical protein